MTDDIRNQPEGSTRLDDISGLLRDDITTRAALDQAESLNVLNAIEWTTRGKLKDVFTVSFYTKLHSMMFDQVWQWAGTMRSQTGTFANIGVAPALVPSELGRVAMEFSRRWKERADASLLPFIAAYHHQLVWVHPFDNGNGRWARLACDTVAERLTKSPRIIWASEDLSTPGDQRRGYIAALRHADEGDLEPLVRYLTRLNPGR
jgi:Fic-DOC domain mobile mystery protein B